MSSSFEDSMKRAYGIASEYRHELVTLEHVLASLLENVEIRDIVVAVGGDIKKLQKDVKDYLDDSSNHVLVKSGIYHPRHTTLLLTVVKKSKTQSLFLGRPELGYLDLFTALFNIENSHASYFLHSAGVDRDAVLQYLNRKTGKDADVLAEKDALDILMQYCVNFNEKAKEGKIDPLIGRENEVESITQSMARRNKHNVIMLGDPGVGKTIIVEGLAKRIVEGDVPETLADKVIWSLDMASIVAGTKFRGDFEERMKNIIVAFSVTKNAIMFIDEIHMIMGAGGGNQGAMDAANLLKPALSRGEIRCIGSTTMEEYRKHFEKDRALGRRFQRIDINEPSIEDSKRILLALGPYYATYHGISYEPEALEAAVELTARYMHDKFLPDKAIDAIDSAGARQKIKPLHERVASIGIDEIRQEVSKIAKVPIDANKDTDSTALLDLETDLRSAVFGQDGAINRLVDAVYVSKSGLREGDKTLGAFLFAGPTGVGKAQPLYSKIKTMDGWITMGDAAVGTKIMSRSGKETTITGVYPQPKNRDVYRIHFDDDRYADASDEHLWMVYSNDWKNKWKILTTMQLIQSMNKRKRHVPLIYTADMSEAKDLPLDPYVLGVILGDGGFGKMTTFTNTDEELISKVKEKLMSGYELANDGPISYYIRRSTMNKHHSQNQKGDVFNEYRKIGMELELDGCRSHEKFIPDIYLNSSYDQRRELLQGLIDTDGYVSGNGSISYSTTSLALANDVVELVRSMGGIAKIAKSADRTYRYNGEVRKCRDAYNVAIRHPNPISLVSLTRKSSRISKNYQYSDVSRNRELKLGIKHIEYLGEMPVQCISVEDEDHLYITDNYVVTHNTEIAKQLASKMGIDFVRFDMSEFQERHTVSRFIGSPPGYVGYGDGAAGSGVLINALEKSPHAVILCDEIEKAHPDIVSIFLQIMDNGMITSNGGKTASARNAFLIFTSNLGAAAMEKSVLGFNAVERFDEDKAAIQQWFAPEFRNRLDAVIRFGKLTKDNMSRILDKFIAQLNALSSSKNVNVVFDPSAKEWLIDKGFDRNMGARPLTRVIDENVKKPLSREMLFGRLKNGGAVMFTTQDGKLIFDILETKITEEQHIEDQQDLEGITA